jgi:Ca2+-dependent lipid-binding protein
LPAADSEGSSDPYIQVWSTDKKKAVTPVVEDNCNPIFFSTLEIYYDFTTPAEAPPIILNVWDKDEDLFDSTDDFIGRSVIFLKDAALSEDDTIPQPKWHKVVMGFSDNEPSIGEILCSFALVPDDFRFKVPTEYLQLTDYIEFKEYNIDINVLGLRNL